MAVTMITNEGPAHKSLEDFRAYAENNPNVTFRMHNHQVDAADVKDGDRVNVVVKASGN